MRAENMTLADIAAALGVSKSSVSLWVRDVPFTPSKRRYGPQRRPHPAHTAKLRQIEELDAARRRAHRHPRRSKPSSSPASPSTPAKAPRATEAVTFANTDERMVSFFCAWLRRFFVIDESRLRVRVYLHEGLDLDAAERTGPRSLAFREHSSGRRTGRSPIRRSAERSTSSGACTFATRAARRTASIMGLIRALLSSRRHSGVAQLAEQVAC